MEYSGLLLIDKERGWTSHDIVVKARNMLRAEIRNKQLENSKNSPTTSSKLPVSVSKKLKVGHTGTLDPMATGLLILVVGSYTKRAAQFSKLDKIYEVTMKLGETSTTGDAEGKKKAVSSKQHAKSEIQEALKQFQGEIMQIPPAYSAVKVDGKRAYKLAREGKEIKLEPRKVTVYGIELIDYSYPEVKLTAKVSSGTYVRSLVEDIGQKLDTGAYMTDLQRTEVGSFNRQEASKITEVNIDKIIKI
ncbi:tRNA pseudouridine(55) synthase TruB [Candidatus Parcubacteria bacterium]|nr:tRNA pseudouridine(55) synthase TruB [Candidatus Parcubacteria bacterium]